MYHRGEQDRGVGWAEFTIMMECTPESTHCQKIRTLSSVMYTYPIDGASLIFNNCRGAGSLGVKLFGCQFPFRKPENSNDSVYRIYPYNSIPIQLERERRFCAEARGLHYMQILDFLASNKSIKQRALLQSGDRVLLQSSWEWIKLSFIDIFFT